MTAVHAHDGHLIALPRNQIGQAPQHVLTTLLGDYWLDTEEMLPSAALVQLVEEFGVTPIAGRAALSRLARRKVLETRKTGRNTYYGLSEPARTTLRRGAHRIVSFGREPRTWDEQWTIVAFSLPEEQRDLRHLVRSRLRWLGFAPLYDGMWVSPHTSSTVALGELVALGVSSASVVTATESVSSPHLKPLLSAWDLDALRAEYEAYILEHEPLLERVRAGSVGAAQALVSRTSVMDTYRRFPALDPELPDSMMPADWPRARTQELFAEIYDGLGALAEIRVRQVVSAFSPELARHVRHHTVAELLQS